MVKDIGRGLKSSISTVVASWTFATDPRNKVSLTSPLIIWVYSGMEKRFGESLKEEHINTLKECDRLWMEAQQLIKCADTWDQAVMRCHKAGNKCIRMANMHDLIDYDVFDDSITDKLFGGAPSAKDKDE